MTEIQEIFRKFADFIEGLVEQEAPNHQVQNAIVEVNTVTLHVLQEVIKFREKNAGLYKSCHGQRQVMRAGCEILFYN